MDILLILQIARTHLLAKVKQTAIAALGVTFGIGTFITLVSFMTGLNGLLDGLVLNRTPHIRIYNELKSSKQQPADLWLKQSEQMVVVESVKPKNTPLKIHNALPLKAELEDNPKVRGVTPQAKAQIFYVAGSTQLNGLVNGVDVMEESRLFNLSDYIIEGTAKDLKDRREGIILGKGVADKLLINIGDRVQITTAKGTQYALKVVGFFQSGLAEIDNVQSYVNLPMAQQLLGESTNYITDLNVKLHDMNQAVAMASQLEELYDITATDIQTANAQFETGTSIRNMITYAVSITLLIVAGFGIYNILNMMIYEKMNDIAILKATGFSGNDVKRIFISQAMIIGIIGGILGLLIGFGMSVLISKAPFETEALPTIKTFPVNFEPNYYIIGIVFALVSTFFAGYLPARKARKMDPVEILRGQ